ncbi:hypothetical protein [Paraburkholderia sp. J12]|uniref:hypothetical protein n=1 Tax=Paraburkholderia sp. J12 TaxID=2805432 RepID=UPI002ABD62F3|nr:hypothetical protein [Paraburkholderia sp. J12]
MPYDPDPGGVRVVLSALQLAAVLTRQSISPTEMLSNRLWGGLQIVGGLLEMVGAGALCRKTGQLVPMSNVRMVLAYQAYNGMPYYVLTAYLDL